MISDYSDMEVMHFHLDVDRQAVLQTAKKVSQIRTGMVQVRANTVDNFRLFSTQYKCGENVESYVGDM